MLVLPRQGSNSLTTVKSICLEVQESLNDFMALGRLRWLETRAILMKLLSEDVPILRDNTQLREAALLQQVRWNPCGCSSPQSIL